MKKPSATIRPNPTLGQHWLTNAGIHGKIIAAAELTSNDTVVEIGPGLGPLTDRLLASGGRVIAVEKDPRLAEYLKNRYRGNSQIEIVEQDVLKFNPTSHKLSTTSYKLIGNIPYYLTSHLFKVIFDTWPMPERMVFLVQKEVAQRIVAKPPDMSLLAVSVQYYARPELVARVSRGSFLPAPKVDSAIIKLRPHRPSTSDVDITRRFFKVVKAGFAGKRKQLANNLAAGLKLPKSAIMERLAQSGIDSRRRAETLALTEWQKLVHNLGT